MFKTLAVFCFALTCAPVFAQAPVTWSSDPESLFHSKDKKLDANKQVVMHIMRDLLEANHWQDASKWLSERYIQHNPNIESGLGPVMKFFGNNPNRPPTPIPDSKSWKSRIVAVVAEGDKVVVAWEREFDNPRKPGTKYTTTWFDMWRIQDGKADEHWDYGTIAPPAK
jgi:predicted SnoaL-like aldol condensation-catalyzing enzyme